MRKFDYSFLDNGLVPANFVSITADICALRTLADVRKGKYFRVFDGLEAAAKVQSVTSSNAIEGIVATGRRIAEIVSKNSAPLNQTESEIAGYRDALDAVHNGYEYLSFGVRDILRLHQIMMSAAGYGFAGSFKDTDNVLMETWADGTHHVRFRPTPASETMAAMEQLELAYTGASSNAHINQLLLIPCVIFDFLCIHPFSDGNGRMSRLLLLLLLYKNGFDAGKYISFEEQINSHKQNYYEALRRSSAGWDKNENDYFPFMQNFLTALCMCYKELDRRFAIVHGKKITKTARIEATVLDSLLPVSKADICAIHPDISPSTVEAVLGRMVKAGQIKRIGSYRSSLYVRN